MKPEIRGLVSEVHFQHSVWKNELCFYLHQLGIFEERLNKTFYQTDPQEVDSEIESFRKDFYIQKKEINNLIELINKNEEKACKYGHLHLKRVDYIVTEEYQGLEKEISVFEKIYKDLKNRFYGFLARNI